MRVVNLWKNICYNKLSLKTRWFSGPKNFKEYPMSNSTFDAIFSRRSCRAYISKKVDDETTALLAKAALAAPSGTNAQPVNLIVVQKAPLILELEKAVVDYFVKNGGEAVLERIRSRKNKIFYDASTVFFPGGKKQGLYRRGDHVGKYRYCRRIPGPWQCHPGPSRRGV
jgi:nitroreductase